MHGTSFHLPEVSKMDSLSSSVSKVSAGGGSIVVSMHAGKAVISELSSAYPLKLLSPYIHDRTALVYLMTYGGGLVGGDEIDLVVKVQPGAGLMLLSQVCLHAVEACRFSEDGCGIGNNEGVQGSVKEPAGIHQTQTSCQLCYPR